MKEEFYTSVDFLVTLCLGRGDGGDVRVDVLVTEEEYKNLMKDGCVYDGTPLYDRVRRAAIEENEYCLGHKYPYQYKDYDNDYDYDDENSDDDERIDYSCVTFMIHPILDELNEDEDEDEDK